MLAICCAVIAGHVAYLLVEWPLTRYLNNRYSSYMAGRQAGAVAG